MPHSQEEVPPVHSLFYPELLLSPVELRRVKRLFKQLEKLTPTVFDISSFDVYQELKRPISEELSRLSFNALQRQTGIEKFMVVAVNRADGYFSRLQILNVELTNNAVRGNEILLYWSLQGRALRKDGSLGFQEARIGFQRARVLRRKLDNSWTEITPRFYSDET